ncbi:MAG: hypothetical protein E4H37_03280 [Gemmatimonadales bacterium]|nr:MAG: hypothetical protein E4H37_03280 [Gemmatimonadales bacterium]
MLKSFTLAVATAGIFGWQTAADYDGALTLTSPGHEHTAQQDFRWSGRIPAGKAIEIKGINGNIVAQGTGGGEVTVTAKKEGHGDDPESVRIEVVEHDDGVTICAVYPDSHKNRPNVCAPKNEGRLNSDDNDVSVDFEISVPAGVRFIGRTVNGDVDATGLTADTDVSTVNGEVEVRTEGEAEASTVNGSIRATMGKATWSGTVEFHTVNGSIEVTLPSDFSAEVRAGTVNGDISTDFPLTVTGRFGPRRVSGTVGGGGRKLELETVNGDISLRKGG